MRENRGSILKARNSHTAKGTAAREKLHRGAEESSQASYSSAFGVWRKINKNVEERKIK